VLFELVNPKLRQLSVPGRANSITESELIHTPASEYPQTRTWAKSLHTAIPGLDALLGDRGSQGRERRTYFLAIASKTEIFSFILPRSR